MSKGKINIAVLMGGTSTEHEISLLTGTTIINALNKDKYNIYPIKIEKSGIWLLPDGYINENSKFEIQNTIPEVKELDTGLALKNLKKENVDVVFIALHGKFGEDGTIQGLLELAGIPYTGSGVLASALAMNKVKSMEIFQFHGLTVPPYIVFDKFKFQENLNELIDEIKTKFGFPCILKPTDGGSSSGIYILKNEKEINHAVRKAFEVSNKLMFQQYIKGDEVTCAVLDTEIQNPKSKIQNPIALPPTQIIPKTSDFFDYKAKYTPGASEEITPARLPQKTIKKIQEISLKAHKILECSGFSRTDMIVKSETRNSKFEIRNSKFETRNSKFEIRNSKFEIRNSKLEIRNSKLEIRNSKFEIRKSNNVDIYILETNTIPGMTETSLYQQAAEKIGLSFPVLLDKIIERALNII